MFPPTRIRSCLPVINPMFRQKLRPHRPFRQTSTLHSQQTKTLQKNKWMNFRSIITRWVPLGSAIYVGWCYIRASINYEVSKVEILFYEMFPFRVTSRIWGKLAAIELPISLRSFVYGTYIKMFNVNLNEAEYTDLKLYKSLSAFFTRPLRDGARYIAPSPCVSPCDGVVLNCGPADTDKIEQVKGVTYSLEEFLGQNKWSKKKDDNYYESLLTNKDNILHQCIIYLAPGDYHRFHSPCDWIATFRRHFSGKLLSVNPWLARLIPGLFTMNERAVYVGEWKHGFFSMTAVGATNVGSIEIYNDPELRTNTKGRRNRINEVELGEVPLKKGELFGQFNMGSTIILLFEAPKEFKFEMASGDKVLVGQALTAAAKEHARGSRLSTISAIGGGDLLRPALVQSMVRSERECDAVTSFCEAVMLAKEVAKREREREPHVPPREMPRASEVTWWLPATVDADLWTVPVIGIPFEIIFLKDRIFSRFLKLSSSTNTNWPRVVNVEYSPLPLRGLSPRNGNIMES